MLKSFASSAMLGPLYIVPPDEVYTDCGSGVWTVSDLAKQKVYGIGFYDNGLCRAASLDFDNFKLASWPEMQVYNDCPKPLWLGKQANPSLAAKAVAFAFYFFGNAGLLAYRDPMLIADEVNSAHSFQRHMRAAPIPEAVIAMKRLAPKVGLPPAAQILAAAKPEERKADIQRWQAALLAERQRSYAV
ncbi:MAG: hypothetical protein AB7G80_03455 [Dongiaceae bacterium]